MHDDIAEILVTEKEIRSKIIELGEQITRDYQGKNLQLLGILKGAVPFIGDLARAINLPLEIDYMAISSYGNTTQSSGVVRILKDLESPLEQKHVLIVEGARESRRPRLHRLSHSRPVCGRLWPGLRAALPQSALHRRVETNRVPGVPGKSAGTTQRPCGIALGSSMPDPKAR